ncbi:MAG: dicarboxylate/amino acid:cation symporter [Candidatus Gastranaerophilales bacterium]|nr:dicarboxylate/amino acid:cation symporter [Candidatus Gastranaerophilales bacterium]
MKIHWQILVALGLGVKRHWHIIFALIAGVVMGLIVQTLDNKEVWINILGFVGQAFIRLIQMVVIPLVASAIIVGIASLGDSKQLGKIGMKMVLYYTLITIMAVVIGSTLALSINPGKNIQKFISHQQAVEVQQQVQVMQDDRSNLGQIYLNMIPNASSLAKGELAPILLFVIVFALALATIGEINRPVVSFFESIFAATMKITDWIMWAATPGVFALTAYSVAISGIKVLFDTRFYILTVIVGLLIQLFIVYPLILRIFSKVNFKSLYRAIAEAMMVAFGTASSSATLPVTIACCERRAGISSKICSFVLPLGATMHMDGTALFQTIAVITLCQAYGVPLDIFSVIQICILAAIASCAAAGIPSGGWISMILILSGLGLSLDQVGQGFTFLFAIDRIVDMFRTVPNVTSDAVVASVIASNEGELDYDLLGNQEVWKEVV